MKGTTSQNTTPKHQREKATVSLLAPLVYSFQGQERLDKIWRGNRITLGHPGGMGGGLLLEVFGVTSHTLSMTGPVFLALYPMGAFAKSQQAKGTFPLPCLHLIDRTYQTCPFSICVGCSQKHAYRSQPNRMPLTLHLQARALWANTKPTTLYPTMHKKVFSIIFGDSQLISPFPWD